ncbi:MAG: 50S ribosomal protein L32 [Gemmatimonadetes bacterium]|nr:50S ribosomal protein L32 [Gemmatimonadota bacterium]
MAVPKRRTSKSRKLKRRTHHKAQVIACQACPRCGDPRRPHRVCHSCGYYAGKQRIEVDDV